MIETQTFYVIVLLLAVWELIWKGIALWKSARNEELTWFICLLVLNTAGILPIIYIHFFSEKKKTKKKIKKN
ncbi:hypothetical protein KO361_00920 [Candidatus Woesearchaeota archaeon]|nr:hypothetical protein [Candidatus Woesearchaeota archaeon]